MGLFGVGDPKVRQLNGDGTYTEITLPKPNERTPHFSIETVTLDESGGDITAKRVGVRFDLTLKYKLGDTDTDITNLATISSVFNLDGNMYVIPYSDVPYQEFVCYLTPNTKIKGLNPTQSQYAEITLEFRGIHLLSRYLTQDDYVLCRPGSVDTSPTPDCLILLDSGRSTGSTTPFIQLI